MATGLRHRGWKVQFCNYGLEVLDDTGVSILRE
jgi:hypothetical protein